MTKVSLDPSVSFNLELFSLRLVLNFLPEEPASLKGFPPLKIELLTGVVLSFRRVFGEIIVVLQVLKLSSLLGRWTLAGVLGDEASPLSILSFAMLLSI